MRRKEWKSGTVGIYQRNLREEILVRFTEIINLYKMKKENQEMDRMEELKTKWYM